MSSKVLCKQGGGNWENKIVIYPAEELNTNSLCQWPDVCMYKELYHNQVPTFAIWEDKSEEPSGD